MSKTPPEDNAIGDIKILSQIYLSVGVVQSKVFSRLVDQVLGNFVIDRFKAA